MPKPDGKQTSKQFEARIKSYPYVAPNELEERIRRNYAKLEVGTSKDRVAELIGDPDCSELDYGPKGPNERWLGSNWKYYIRKRENSSNAYDPCLEVFLDTDDRLHWIVPSNID